MSQVGWLQRPVSNLTLDLLSMSNSRPRPESVPDPKPATGQSGLFDVTPPPRQRSAQGGGHEPVRPGPLPSWDELRRDGRGPRAPVGGPGQEAGQGTLLPSSPGPG